MKIFTCRVVSKLPKVLPNQNHVERESSYKSIIVNDYKYLIFEQLYYVIN